MLLIDASVILLLEEVLLRVCLLHEIFATRNELSKAVIEFLDLKLSRLTEHVACLILLTFVSLHCLLLDSTRVVKIEAQQITGIVSPGKDFARTRNGEALCSPSVDLANLVVLNRTTDNSRFLNQLFLIFA